MGKSKLRLSHHRKSKKLLMKRIRSRKVCVTYKADNVEEVSHSDTETENNVITITDTCPVESACDVNHSDFVGEEAESISYEAENQSSCSNVYVNNSVDESSNDNPCYEVEAGHQTFDLKPAITGRRIIDVSYFFNQIKEPCC
ncbi:hypothetical protein FQR65_LT19478 [Abscondita terminalis]|nr:hypothetical protein FQR65_LT19478 [Abscondita terminalis]